MLVPSLDQIGGIKIHLFLREICTILKPGCLSHRNLGQLDLARPLVVINFRNLPNFLQIAWCAPWHCPTSTIGRFWLCLDNL